MIVRELIENNACITDLTITIRDAGILADQLNIGPDFGIKPPYPTVIDRGHKGQREATYINKNINAWDDGRDYWEIKPDRIPAKWLGLEVTSWSKKNVYRGHHRRDDLAYTMEGYEITAKYPGYAVPVIVKHEEKEEKKSGWEHLDGQLSIFDMEG